MPSAVGTSHPPEGNQEQRTPARAQQPEKNADSGSHRADRGLELATCVEKAELVHVLRKVALLQLRSVPNNPRMLQRVYRGDSLLLSQSTPGPQQEHRTSGLKMWPRTTAKDHTTYVDCVIDSFIDEQAFDR